MSKVCRGEGREACMYHHIYVDELLDDDDEIYSLLI